ncbi:MAG: hypothetical protein ACFE0P_11225 [Oceanicaulis sp.]
MGAALLVAGLGLTACSPDADEAPETGGETASQAVVRSAVVTSAFEPSAPARGLAFLPTAETPWTGLVATSLRDGGFDVFSVEGQRLISSAGPQLNAIAAAPDFALRGEVFPLLFGVDEAGALRGFAVLRQADDVVELPLEGDALVETAAAVCTLDSGIGYVDIAVLAQGPEAVVARVRDTGGDGLTLTEQARLPLPFAARSCAPADGDLIVAGPTSGLARLDMNGETRAFAAGLGVTDIGYAQLLGRPAVMAASSDTGRLNVFDARTLDKITDIETEAGLNAPAFDTPVALAVTSASYGGMAFSSGLVAVYDRADSRVKIVAREVVARAVVSPES